MTGRLHRSIEHQHRHYGSTDSNKLLKEPVTLTPTSTGPVFRVSPNELSFASVPSWRAIYGPPPNGRGHCIKSEFYDVFSAGYDSKCIGSERLPQRHAQMKKAMSPAFSTTALREQEDIIRGCVDAFIDKIRAHSLRGTSLNMTHWYEMLAFDILGELAFGQSFNCIRDEKPHFWFEMLTKYLFSITLIDNLRRFPILPTIGRIIAPLFAGVQQKQQEYSRQLVERYRKPRSILELLLKEHVGASGVRASVPTSCQTSSTR